MFLQSVPISLRLLHAKVGLQYCWLRYNTVLKVEAWLETLGVSMSFCAVFHKHIEYWNDYEIGFLSPLSPQSPDRNEKASPTSSIYQPVVNRAYIGFTSTSHHKFYIQSHISSKAPLNVQGFLQRHDIHVNPRQGRVADTRAWSLPLQESSRGAAFSLLQGDPLTSTCL